MSRARVQVQSGIAAVTAFCFFWSSILPAQPIVPDGNTATTLREAGSVTDVSTATIRGINAFNSFSRFNVEHGRTINLHLPDGTRNLLNLVHDERTQIDGVLNSIRAGRIGGQVFFANPHGLVVGETGVVNVGALQVTTPTREFMARFFEAPGEPSAAAAAQLIDGTVPLDPAGLIAVRGRVNATGDVKLHGGGIDVSGQIRVDPAVAGAVDFSDVVNVEGMEEAGRVTLEQGEVALRAAGDALISGEIRSDGRDGVGAGAIEVRAGRDIRLEGGARLAANGRGAGSDGGRVVVFAGRDTDFGAGAALEARGGEDSGDGGFIELSAKETVRLAGGRLDATARHGAAGTALIDPAVFAPVAGSTINLGGADGDNIAVTGTHLKITAEERIALDNVKVSSRQVDGAGHSVADSGNLTLEAPAIELGNGTRLESYADGVYKAGTISLFGNTISIDNSALQAYAASGAGAILIEAAETPFLDNPFSTDAVSSVLLRAADLDGGDVTVRARASAGRVFDVDDGSTATGEDADYWDAAAFGDDAIRFLASVRPFLGLGIATSTATVTLDAGTLPGKFTDIDATGAVTITAEADARSQISALGTVAAVAYGRAKSDATLIVDAKTTISAVDGITLGSSIDNSIDVAAKVIDLTKGGDGKGRQVPLDVVVAVTEAYGTAHTTVAPGASLISTGADSEIAIRADSSKDLGTEVQAGAGGDLLGAAVAVTLSDTYALTDVGAAIDGAGSVLIEARAETAGNETVAEAAIGDNYFEEFLEEGGIAKTPPSLGFLNKAGVLEALAEWIGGKILANAKVSEKSGSSNTFVRDNGLSAAVAVANHRNEAAARVGAGAEVQAGGDLSVVAETVDRQQLSAASETSKSDDDASGGKKNAASAAVIVGNFDNVATASVTGTAGHVAALDAKGVLAIRAKTRVPYEVRWAPLDAATDEHFSLTDWIDAIPGSDLGIPDTFFNSWAQAAAEARDIALAGAIDVLDIDNVAQAYVGPYAVIDGDPDFIDDDPGDVEVSALAESFTVNLAGVANFFLEALSRKGIDIFSTGADSTGAGGSYLGVDYDQTAAAWIDAGAAVAADDLLVAADTKATNVSIAAAGAQGGKYGFAGSFSLADVRGRTSARIDESADVMTLGALRIQAHDDTLDVNVSGGIGEGAAVGVGAAVAWNDFDRRTQALVGEDVFLANPFGPGGSLVAGGAFAVEAGTSGDIWTAALAAANPAEDKDVPAAPEPGAAKETRATKQGAAGLHISGDVAINELRDDTLAYVNGGATIESGVPAPPATPDEPALPSLGLTAANDSRIWALGGAVSADLSKGGSGSGTSVGLAGSFALNSIGGRTESFLAGGGPMTTAGDGVLTATRGGRIRSLTASGSGAKQKSGLNLAGSVSINEITNVTGAYLAAADIDTLAGGAAAGHLRLTALDTSDIFAIAGAATLGGKGGFGAAVTVNSIVNATTAYADKSRLVTAGDLVLDARNANDIRAIGASLGLSDSFSISGVGTGNEITNRAEAWLDNTDTAYTLAGGARDYGLGVAGDVSVTAEDASEIEVVAASGAASKGAGIGASVAVNELQNAARARATNVTYDAGDGEFELHARNLAANFGGDDPDTDPEGRGGIRAVAGALGVGKTGGAGVAVAVNRTTNTTQAWLDGAHTRVNARNVAVDATSEGAIATLAVGLGAGGTVGAAGSVVTNFLGNATSAHIDGGAEVVAANNAAVRAESDDRITVAAGSAGIGVRGAGVGASVTVNEIRGETSAYVGGTGPRTHVAALATEAADTLMVNAGALDSTVDLASAVDVASYAGPDLKSKKLKKPITGLAVNASATQHIENIDVNVAAGAGLGAGAAVNVNLVGGTTQAYLTNALVNQDDALTGGATQQVDVTASNHAYGNGFVGNVAVGGAAFGAALDSHFFGRTTRAYVADSTLDASESVRVNAIATHGASSFAVGGSVGGFALAGSGAVAKFGGLTEAYVSHSTLVARIIDVRAQSLDRMHLVGGALALAGGTGVAGTFALGIDDSVTRAYVDGGAGGRSSLFADDAITVDALGEIELKAFAVGGSGAGGIGVAGMATVNLLTGTVESYVADTDVSSAERPAGGLAIQATARTRVDDTAGALAVGGAAGIGAGASVNVLKSRVAAGLTRSAVHADGAVQVNAESENRVAARAVTAGVGGTFGIGGAAVVTVIGVKPDANALRETDSGNKGTLTEADELAGSAKLADTGSDDTAAMSAEERSGIEAAARHSVKSTVVDDAPFETVASVQDSEVYGGSLAVRAADGTSAASLAGGLGGGLLGAGGGVGVTHVRANVRSFIDPLTRVDVTGELRVIAGAGRATAGGPTADITAFAGGGGLVGLGAAVAYADVDNVVLAELGGEVAHAGAVRVEAVDSGDIEAQAIGAAIGAAAAGISVAHAEKSSRITAMTTDGDADTHVGVTSGGGDMTVAATSAGRVTATSTAAAGGLLLAGSGADAEAVDAAAVTARTGAHSVLELGTGTLRLAAVAAPRTRAEALGGGVSLGGQVGVSQARAQAAAAVQARLGAASRLRAGALDVHAAQVRNEGAPTAVAVASGSGGGLLFGVNATTSDALTTVVVGAGIDAEAWFDLAGDATVLASADGEGAASASGVSIGIVALGANRARAVSGSDTRATVAGGVTGKAAGQLTVLATGADATFADAEAGAGGFLAGAASAGDTRNESTTIAELAAGTEASPLELGGLDLRAVHLARFGGEVSSLNASVLGASGAGAVHRTTATVEARLAAGTRLNTGTLVQEARNVVRKPARAGFDLQAGSGGIFGGAAARSDASMTLATRATLGEAALVRVTGGADGAGTATIAAVNELDANDRVRLDAGGAIAVARAESALLANTLAAATLATGAQLDSTGDVTISAGTRALLYASANAKTYGFAGAAEGHSVAVLNVGDVVGVGTGARIRAAGDVTLAAGRDASGGGDFLRATARTDLYNKTAFPVATSPDADAVVNRDSRVEVAAGGRVNAVEDIALIADPGYAVADGRGIGKDLYREILAAIGSFFSRLFGGGSVSLDIHGGSSRLTGGTSVRVDGEVAAGIQHEQRLVLDRAGRVVERTEGVGITPTVENIVAKLIADLDEFVALRTAYAGDAIAQAKYDAEIQRIRRQLADLGYTGADDNTVPVIEVWADFITVDNVRARGGDVTVQAGSLLGTGAIDAPGDAAILIQNGSAANLRVKELTIEEAGGLLRFNGAVVRSNADIDRRNAPGSEPARFALLGSGATGDEPRIEVLNSYVPEAAADGSAGRAPDILVTSDITNGSGLVRIHNLRGGVFIQGEEPEFGPRIIADTVDIDAGGDFVQSYVNGLYQIGGLANDPSTLWGDVARASEAAKTDRSVAGSRSGTGSIIAGNNVFISARYLDINGTVQSGIADWSLTLGADLADDLDAFRDAYRAAVVAGEQPAESKLQLSAFLSDPKGTIAAFYNPESDRIELEGVRVRGGYMQLFGEVLNTGGGQLKVLDGYGRIDVMNETGRDLELNGLDTGSDIEGTLVVTDTARLAEVDGVMHPVTTRYTRLGDDVRIERLVLVEGEEVTLDTPDVLSDRRSAEYLPVPGLRYVWTTGQDFINKYIGTASRTTVFGFIPAGSAEYDSYAGPDPVTDTPIRDGEYTALAAAGDPGYTYDFGTFESADEQFAGRREWSTCSFWFFGCIVRTYYVQDTWITGSREFHTHSVRADHPIAVEFIGYDQGNIEVASDGNLLLGGSVRNTAGEVVLTSSGGAIRTLSESAAIRGTDIALTAATGIGSADSPLVTQAAGGAVRAEATAGDVALRTLEGDLVVARAATGDGDVYLYAEGNLLGTGPAPGPHVAGRRVDLASTLGTIGAAGAPLVISTMAVKGGGLAATALGDIDLAQSTGDLALDRVESLDGDVRITVRDGDLLDGNTHEVRDTRAESELLALWNDLALLGAAAETSREETLAAFVRQKESGYRSYWQYRKVRELRDSEGRITGYAADAYDPGYAYAVSAAEAAQLRAAGFDDTAIAGYAARRTAGYHALHAEWGDSGPYAPDFVYAPTAADRAGLSDGYLWQESELRHALAGGIVFKTTTDTETSIEAPNVIGRNVLLRAQRGSMGAERGEIPIDAKLQSGLTEPQRIALAAAEADDVAIDTANEVVHVLLREDVDVAASGSLVIEGIDHVYLGSEADLNVDTIASGGSVRIKAAGAVYDVSTSTAATIQADRLIVEAAAGDVGAASAPLRIALGTAGTLVARAGGSLFIDELAGDLRVAEAFTPRLASLAAAGSVLDARGDRPVAIDAGSAGIVSRGGDVGAADDPLLLKLAATGALAVAAPRGGVAIDSPSGDLTVRSVVAGGDARLAAAGSLLGTGGGPHVVGERIALESLFGSVGTPLSYFVIDSHGKVSVRADTGIALEERHGDLLVERMETRIGPVLLRVVDGDAIFDTIHTDEDFVLSLGHGSLRMLVLDAHAVDVRLLGEDSELAIDVLYTTDGVVARADRIHLPRLVHTGTPDSLWLDFRGNDGGLADDVQTRIESRSPVQFDALFAREAAVASDARQLGVARALVGSFAEIGNASQRVVVTGPRPPRPATAQLFAGDRPFSLTLTDAGYLLTDAPVVDYDPRYFVNRYSSENSMLRLSRKVLATTEAVVPSWLPADPFAMGGARTMPLAGAPALEALDWIEAPGAGDFQFED